MLMELFRLMCLFLILSPNGGIFPNHASHVANACTIFIAITGYFATDTYLAWFGDLGANNFKVCVHSLVSRTYFPGSSTKPFKSYHFHVPFHQFHGLLCACKCHLSPCFSFHDGMGQCATLFFTSPYFNCSSFCCNSNCLFHQHLQSFNNYI